MRDFINNLGNLMVPFLLRSPLHIFLSSSILLITFTGRKSGRTYTTPVQYLCEGNTLTLFTQRSRVWWRNLRGGAPVEVLVRGKPFMGTASTTTADENEARILAQMAKLYAGMSQDKHRAMADDLVMIQIERVT